MISIVNLHKNFGVNQVLNGIDLTISKGQTVAILGPNGSGKTTLIKSILGMVKPNSGDILMADINVKNKWDYRKNIDYLPQIANFPGNLKVIELIRMIKDIRGNINTYENHFIEVFGLNPFLNKKLNHLSGGTKQKVNLVLTFMFDSDMIILDEPTSGLDPVSLIALKNLIASEKQKGKTILITSHIMSFVEEVCDKLVFILDGKIYFNDTIQVLKETTKEENFEKAIAHLLTHAHV
jgi:Cu-processing system ATP-binding protein